VALRFVYSRERRGGQRQRTVRQRRSEAQGGDAARPEEGDDPERWAEWASLAAGLAKGFGPKSRI
jgi:hypothetical protein